MPRKRRSASKRNGNHPSGSTSTAPAAVGTISRTSEPRFSHSRDGVRIKHRELVHTLTVPTSGFGDFGVTSFALNPGVADTFPWLSQEAEGFEQYRFHSLSAVVLARVGTDTAGSTLLATDYNADDPEPSNERDMSAYMGSVEGPVWQNMTMHMDVNAMFPAGPRKYVRAGRARGDIKTYDVGNLFVAAMDMVVSPGSAVSKIYLEYDVEFFVPSNGVTDNVEEGYLYYGYLGPVTSPIFDYMTFFHDNAILRKSGIAHTWGVDSAGNECLVVPPGLYELTVSISTVFLGSSFVASGNTNLSNGTSTPADTDVAAINPWWKGTYWSTGTAMGYASVLLDTVGSEEDQYISMVTALAPVVSGEDIHATLRLRSLDPNASAYLEKGTLALAAQSEDGLANPTKTARKTYDVAPEAPTCTAACDLSGLTGPEVFKHIAGCVKCQEKATCMDEGTT